VQALGVRMPETGPELSPGVIWMTDCTQLEILPTLRSGYFGDEEFFLRASDAL
jgi:uncharacterized protein YgbK (DUF1537 family)